MSEITTKLPIWYWILTAILALWALMGLWVFYDFMTTTPEKLVKYVTDGTFSQEYADYYSNSPLWHMIVFAIAIFSNLLGVLNLIVRKAWAAPLYTLSLLMVVISLIKMFAIDKVYTIMSSGQIGMECVVLVLGILGVWFAHISKAKGWLK
ncbi:MAG: hypothetical protein V3U57_09750 [Robiginitomaculum sp.]